MTGGLDPHFSIYNEARAFIEGYLSPGVKPHPHGHPVYIAGCWRCDLSRAEVDDPTGQVDAEESDV